MSWVCALPTGKEQRVHWLSAFRALLARCLPNSQLRCHEDMHKFSVQFCGKLLCTLGWDVQSGADMERTKERLREKKKTNLTVLTAARKNITDHVAPLGEDSEWVGGRRQAWGKVSNRAYTRVSEERGTKVVNSWGWVILHNLYRL